MRNIIDGIESKLFTLVDDVKLMTRKTDQNTGKILLDLDTLRDYSSTWLLEFHPRNAKGLSLGKGQEDWTRSIDTVIIYVDLTQRGVNIVPGI